MSGWFILTIVVGVLLIATAIILKIGEDNDSTIYFWLHAAALVLIILFVIFILIGTISLISAKDELAEYTEKANVIEQVVENGGNLESTGVNNIVIDYNNWLVKVKVNQQRYGIFSDYYYIDVSNMEYFVLK